MVGGGWVRTRRSELALGWAGRRDGRRREEDVFGRKDESRPTANRPFLIGDPESERPANNRKHQHPFPRIRPIPPFPFFLTHCALPNLPEHSADERRGRHSRRRALRQIPCIRTDVIPVECHQNHKLNLTLDARVTSFSLCPELLPHSEGHARLIKFALTGPRMQDLPRCPTPRRTSSTIGRTFPVIITGLLAARNVHTTCE